MADPKVSITIFENEGARSWICDLSNEEHRQALSLLREAQRRGLISRFAVQLHDDRAQAADLLRSLQDMLSTQ